MVIPERVLAGKVPHPQCQVCWKPPGKDRMPRTEFHCPHVIGAWRLFFSVHFWSGVRTEERKILLEVDSKPMGIDGKGSRNAPGPVFPPRAPQLRRHMWVNSLLCRSLVFSLRTVGGLCDHWCHWCPWLWGADSLDKTEGPLSSRTVLEVKMDYL